ncbi:MAG: hypothetical protein HN390_13740 [Anaerolineae bacterium]|jgi:hypothetical protein|nr:hypothetical protein [Anaerolineae bacterium]MBT7190440.1 hypothetical protein [Anaerolineae bacterium]MBT7991193.1 hypothetical protein [Anaerolineae bacterium]
MTKKIRIIIFILTMFALSLFGCTGATSVPEIPTEEPTEEAAPAPKLAAVVDAVEPNYCLDCHADKERLVKTGEPIVEVKSESEGAG